MLLVWMVSCVFFILSGAVMTLAALISKKGLLDREKSSSFECGFDPSSSSRLPFSLRFFLIAVFFLIFDVEIALLLPLVLTLGQVDMSGWFFMGVGFIVILLLGLFYEWNQGALNWAF
uniref:NADH-ubiquinone oxidoreductase chain 3 n=1 Tax=Challia fletcheri TaxID=1091408 RepID=J7EXF7_9NEOP|nr:NADH dehydrogenase subunit 3 [Challia fletcheri]AEP83054.1 NADH dehydrogenase subunit 3 [Challia fletcheri]